METLDAMPDGMRLSDWIEAAGISRTAAYELMKAAGIEPEARKVPGSRKPVSFLAGEALEVMEHLARQLRDGKTVAELRQAIGQSGIVPNRSEPSGMVRRDDPGQSGIVQAEAMAVLAQAMRPPVDPLACARRMVEAAELGVALSNAELADVLGFAPGTVSRWADGHVPRPGFRLRRVQEGEKSPVFWIVERTGQSGTVPRITAGGQGRSVGFHAAELRRDDVIEARVVELPGPALFPVPRW